jgi:hypothetical protein
VRIAGQAMRRPRYADRRHCTKLRPEKRSAQRPMLWRNAADIGCAGLLAASRMKL